MFGLPDPLGAGNLVGGITGGLPGGGIGGGMPGIGGGLPGIGGGLPGLGGDPMVGGQSPPGMGIQPVTSQFQQYTVPGPQDQSAYAGSNPSMNFMAPGAAEQFYAQNQGRFNTGPQNPTTNRAEEWYQGYKGTDLASLDPYYARQQQKGQANLDQALAARGMLASGPSAAAAAEFNAALGAEQANREAEHQLQYQGLGGQLARSADISSQGQSQDELGWMLGGMGAAGQAQNAQRMRGRDFMSDIAMGMGATMPVLGQGYNDMLGMDYQLFGDTTDAMMGRAREGASQAYRLQERQKADEQHGAGMLGSFFGGLGF